MADVELTVQQLPQAGVDLTDTALSTANTYYVRNNGKVCFQLKKANAVDCVMTIDVPLSIDGLAVPDRTFTCAASGGELNTPPLNPAVYNQDYGSLPGYIKFTVSDHDGATIATYQVDTIT